MDSSRLKMETETVFQHNEDYGMEIVEQYNPGRKKTAVGILFIALNDLEYCQAWNKNVFHLLLPTRPRRKGRISERPSPIRGSIPWRWAAESAFFFYPSIRNTPYILKNK